MLGKKEIAIRQPHIGQGIMGVQCNSLIEVIYSLLSCLLLSVYSRNIDPADTGYKLEDSRYSS